MLLPHSRYADEHHAVLSTLSALNVCAVLGDRLDLASLDKAAERDGAERIVRTQSGREIRAELVVSLLNHT